MSYLLDTNAVIALLVSYDALPGAADGRHPRTANVSEFRRVPDLPWQD